MPAGAVLALGVALVQYVAERRAPPTPIAGAYRHIATEALHLVRRARYQIEPAAIRALLQLVERLGAAPEWLLDTWLLRVERALDLEAEHGAYLENYVAGLPNVARLLRGDERIGWETRMAHDLAVDRSQYEPAARCSSAARAASRPAAPRSRGRSPPSRRRRRRRSSTSTGSPRWRTRPASRRRGWRSRPGCSRAASTHDGFAAACRGMTAATAKERPQALVELRRAVARVGHRDADRRRHRISERHPRRGGRRHDEAARCFMWARAVRARQSQARAEPRGRARAARRRAEAIRVLAANERDNAPRLVGRVLVDAGRYERSGARAALRVASVSLAPTTGRCSRRPRPRPSTTPSPPRPAAARSRSGGPSPTCVRARDRAVQARRVRRMRADRAEADRAREPEPRHSHRRAARDGARARRPGPSRRRAPVREGCAEASPTGELAADLIETMDRSSRRRRRAARPSPDTSMERSAYADLEAGKVDASSPRSTSPSWGITCAALAASEFPHRRRGRHPRRAARARSRRDRARRAPKARSSPRPCSRESARCEIRDNAYIQIDPPPPLGLRYTAQEFDQLYAERDRRPHRPSALQSYAR